MTIGRNCDKCGAYIDEEDFKQYRSWSYKCSKCGFEYNHGVTIVDKILGGK